ncbi:MAG: AGE family epimerase/isomerase [Planctomycetota bacterium]
MLTNERIDELIAVYRDGLLDDTLPFWIDHCVDREHGGFLFCLGRDGSVIDTDKPMWLHGRFVWVLSTLCRQVEPRPEWLELARHGIDFIRSHGFDDEAARQALDLFKLVVRLHTTPGLLGPGRVRRVLGRIVRGAGEIRLVEVQRGGLLARHQVQAILAGRPPAQRGDFRMPRSPSCRSRSACPLSSPQA